MKRNSRTDFMSNNMSKEQMVAAFAAEEARHRPVNKGGKAAGKTLTASVRAAEAARDEARTLRGDALRACERMERMQKGAEDAAVRALTDCRVVCGRAVAVCVACAGCALLPWAVWLLRGLL